jgi:hypothetical protein
MKRIVFFGGNEPCLLLTKINIQRRTLNKYGKKGPNLAKAIKIYSNAWKF